MGDPVSLEPEPNNPHDAHAIRLINQALVDKGCDGWLGFIPRKYSCLFSEAIGNGHCFDATISRISGTNIMGVTISLEVTGSGHPLLGR